MIAAPGEDPLLEGILPPDVVVVELFADPPGVDLFPQEAEIMGHAVAKRRREFATVRLCARTALARLGRAPGPILPARDGPLWARRAPRWPDGIVGSMTHCDGYRAAAVARDEEVASLGVDAEPNAPLPEGIQETVLLPEERDTVARLAASHPGVAWDRLLFSAKESVFKTWFPLTGRWLDFPECAISPDPDLGTFSGILKVPGPTVAGERIDRFPGRWRVGRTGGEGLVATTVVVPAQAPAAAPQGPGAPGPPASSWPDRITRELGTAQVGVASRRRQPGTDEVGSAVGFSCGPGPWPRTSSWCAATGC